MIFTGAPQNKKRIPLEELFLKEAKELAKASGIEFSNCLVHAPYIFNLASEDTDGFIKELISNEIKRTVGLGIKYFVIHPGYYFPKTKDKPEGGELERFKYLIQNIKEILQETKNLDYYLLLETMSGKKNQIGAKLEDFKEIFESCNWDPKLAVCLDTVHMNDSGYDLSDIDFLKENMEKLIRLHRVKAIHLGDSMNTRGSRKDRHANLGYGHIGFENLINIAYDEYFSTLPIIVETPYWREKILTKRGSEKEILVSPYKHEIQLVRDKVWKPVSDKKYRVIYKK